MSAFQGGEVVKAHLDELLKEALEGALIGAPRAARVAVACSGGADSMALTDALARLAPALGVEAVVLTVEHGLHERAREAAEGVCAYWRSRGVEAHLLRASAELIEQGRGVEEGARRARYSALEEARRSLKLSLILLAHHADDQAETLLMRLQGPTGARGLAGIPTQRGHLLRPWLSVEGRHLKAFASAQGLPLFEDPTNQDERFLRNRLRAHASPALERAFGEGWASRAHQSAAHLREHIEGAQWLIAEQLRGRVLVNHHRVELSWAEGLEAPTYTQRLVLHELWRRVLPRLAPELDPRRVQEHLTPLWEAWGGLSSRSVSSLMGCGRGGEGGA
jgi:tRNA(Ile)-lysidine synthase